MLAHTFKGVEYHVFGDEFTQPDANLFRINRKLIYRVWWELRREYDAVSIEDLIAF